jgi:hypothetical protein
MMLAVCEDAQSKVLFIVQKRANESLVRLGIIRAKLDNLIIAVAKSSTFYGTVCR